MPDDHSKLVPLLPIPNRTVKRLSADDSAGSRVKVGHRQALTMRSARLIEDQLGVYFLYKPCVFVCLESFQSKQKLKFYLTRFKKPVYNLRLR
jgi:hypothetical protein